MLKLNRETTELVISVEVKQGAENVAPTLDEFSDANLYTQELSLAQLVVTGDSNEVTIIDERNSEFCGAVRTIADSAGASSGFHPLALKADIQDLTLVKWNKEDGCWEGSDEGYMVFYEGKLYGNGSMTPVSGYATSDENTVYADENGVMSTEVNKTIVGAFCENGAYLSVCVISEQVGVPVAYTDNMLQFNAIPSASTTIAIQVEMPSTADGVKIHRSTSAYDGTGLLWGTEIADIVDDSSYHGASDFYRDTGLVNNVQYYYKAFPYAGTTYNILSGENESTCFSRNGLCYWSMDNLSGTTIIDEFGNYNLTAYNTVFSPYVSGDGAYISGTNSYLQRSSRIISTSGSYVFVIWTSRPESGLRYLFCNSESNEDADKSYGRSHGSQIAINSSGDFVVEYGTNQGGGAHGILTTAVGATAGLHMLGLIVGAHLQARLSE